MKLYDGDIFEQDGYTFRVSFTYDDTAGYPWDNSEGHGPVRRTPARHAEGFSDKRPGERPLNQAGRNEYQFYYDWAEAMRIAERDGWNTEPYDAPGKAARAVAADFEYLRAFLADDWEYVGVIVTRVEFDEDGDYVDFESDSLWQVETFNDWHMEQAREMAAEMARYARKEESERAHWAARDVATV